MVQILRDRMRDRRTWAVAAVVVLVAVAAAVSTYLGSLSSFVTAASTLNVISGEVRVTPEDGAVSRSGVDGEAIVAGATVQTQDRDGRAVLTFRDGSTVELEPETSVKIEQLSLGARGELVVRLYQERGKTWSHVQPLLSPNSRVHIKTPSATAAVRGTSFEIDVAGASGATVTRLTVFEGTVDLVAAGKVESIPAGHTSEVAEGDAPRAAQRLTLAGVCMRIEVNPTALITVTDPDGRSAGQTRLGTLSQIPYTMVTGPQADPQAVDLFSPRTGDWEISIVPRDEGGVFQMRVTTVVGTQTLDERGVLLALQLGERAVTRIRLGDDGETGGFESPLKTTETRAVALPSEPTTTAVLPQAKLVVPAADGLTPTCGTP